MYLSEELEKIFKIKKIKDIIIFSSALWSQNESIVCTLRNYTGANIHLFFRDEDINNLNLETLCNSSGIRYNAYRLDISSFLKIKNTKPQLVIILCDNPYNIGYRKAKLFSLICGADTVLFNNILNDVKYFNLKELWRCRTKFIKSSIIVFADSIIAPLFFIIFICIAYILKLAHRFNNHRL